MLFRSHHNRHIHDPIFLANIPARARKLLKNGKAAVYRRYPFIIIMKCRVGGDLQPIEIKFDPGSRTTGIALVGHFDRGPEVIWAGNLNHRGHQIKRNLD